MPIWQKFILKVLSVFFIILICGNLHITGWCGQTNMSTSDMSWYAEPDYVVHIDAATAPDTKTTAGNQSVRFPDEGHTQGTTSRRQSVTPISHSRASMPAALSMTPPSLTICGNSIIWGRRGEL